MSYEIQTAQTGEICVQLSRCEKFTMAILKQSGRKITMDVKLRTNVKEYGK